MLTTALPSRELLLRYTGKLALTSGQRQPFASTDLPALQQAVNTDAPFLSAYLQALESKSIAPSRRSAHLEFISQLSYNTPVDGGLIKGMHIVRPVLTDIVLGSPVSMASVRILAKYFPALKRLLEHDDSLRAGLPVGDALRNVPQAECSPQVNITWTAIVPENDLQAGIYYPCLTERRPVNSYTMQTRKSDVDSCAQGCRKATHKFQRVLPGLQNATVQVPKLLLELRIPKFL